MATGKQIQSKGSSHFTPTPATGMFKPRPFAEPAKPEAATPEVQTKVELGNTGGDRLAGMQVSAPAPIQPKLAIGTPGDKYEQEADTIARKVVQQISAPTPPDSNPSGDEGSVQRQFSAPSISRLVVQRREAIEGGEASSSVESSINQARSSGVPLGAPIRRQMEGAFGADFSGVRIHANNTADTLNRELSSRAFTTGNHIFFKRGEYNPGNSTGKELLAHELTHVVQQTGGNTSQIQRVNSVENSNEVTVSKAVEKDPELIEKHKGEKVQVKAGKPAKVIKNGEISSVFYSGPIQVTDIVELSPEYFIFPGDKKSYPQSSTEGGFYPPFGENKKAKIIAEDNGFAKCNVQGYTGEFWIPKNQLVATKEDGYKCKFKNGSETIEVWVAKNDIEKSEAGYTDKSQASLFPEDPTPDHVLQGNIGNCYLMAALASLAKTDPNYIKGMIKDNEDAKDGTGGTVTVRLYDVSNSYQLIPGKNSYNVKDFKANQMDIKINKSVAQKNGEDLYAKNHLWVQMIEKAYAASGSQGNPHDNKLDVKPSYQNIIGGSSAYAFEVLTGKKSSYTSIGTNSKAEEILQQIQEALDQGKAVAAGTRQLTQEEKKEAAKEGGGHSAGEAKLQGIVATHAYSILGVDVGNQKILLRNPWGEYGVKYENGTQTADKEQGTFWLKVGDFFNRFNGIHMSGKVKTL